MTHAHGGVLVGLVALGLGVVAGNLVVAAGAKMLKGPRLEGLAPTELSRLALTGLLLPALLGLLALAAVASVPAVALLMPALDHCLAQTAAPHLCFVHGTLDFSSVWEAAGVGILGFALAAALGREGVRLWRSHRALDFLLGARPESALWWTDDDAPYAFTVGLLHPRVVVSSGLRRVLTARQLEAALAHEQAHVLHLDGLVRVLARVSSFVLVRPLRRRLAALLVLGQEKRADATAAVAVGSQALVAETLLALFRASASHGPASNRIDAPALVGHALELRIKALCRPPCRGRITAHLTLAVVLMACTLLGAQTQLHQSAESIAGVLLSSPVHGHHHTPAGGPLSSTRAPQR